MNKILRYSFIALLAFVCQMSFAQTTILWQEDFSSYKADDTPKNGTYSYACTNGAGTTKIYEENLAGGTSPELLVGKKKNASSVGGSFSATIPLNGTSGALTLTFKANKNVTVTATGATVGTQTRSGNDYSFPITVAAGTESITITITSATTYNTRLDNIKLFQGEAKKPAGLSWGTSARTVTIGSEDNVFPTLTNANNLTIAYSSSAPEIATIDAEGNITLVSAGETTIKASFAGNDEYEAGEVEYKLTVKAAPTVDLTNTPETAYSVAKAIELINAGEGLDTKVYVLGTISTITEVSTTYKNATYNISDDGTTSTELTVYRGKYLGGADFTSTDQIKVGDKVIVYGKLTSYNSTPRVNANSEIYSLNDETTNIAGITTTEAANDAPVYNLAGQKVTSAYKGVVIKAGKKFVQK